MLASRERLERYIRTAGAAVGRQSALDSELLDDVLAAASSRIVQAVPDRTLEAAPALVQPEGDPLPPRVDTAEPQARQFLLDYAGASVVQVPDLRVLESATIDGRELDVARITFRRRPGELCALWVRLPHRETGELELIGRWGPALARVGTPVADLAVDPAISEACVQWAARVYWNRASRGADNVQDPAGGSVLGYFRNLPPDVKVVLDGLVVPGL